MFVNIQPNKCINHSRLMKSHEISSRYREQLKDNRVTREKQKLLTLTVRLGIQACDCGRFGVGWAVPSSPWNSPSYSPKHHEPNRAASDRSNWSPLNPAENTRHAENTQCNIVTVKAQYLLLNRIYYYELIVFKWLKQFLWFPNNIKWSS